MLNNFNLFLDDLDENPIFDCKNASDSVGTLRQLSGDAHPKRYSCQYFKNNAAQTPDIYNPGVFIAVHQGEHALIVLKLVLEKDIVEDLRWHVLRSGHGKLFEVSEQKTTTKIDKFNSLDISTFALAHVEQDVLGFEV